MENEEKVEANEEEKTQATINEPNEQPKVKEAETKKQEQSKVQEVSQEPKKDEKPKEQKFEKAEGTTKKKHSKAIISIAVIVIAAVVAFVLWLTLRTKTIDLSQCLSIKYEGYNGHATAIITLDEKALKNKISDSDVAKRFIKKAELELENYENLSNGDEISVKIKISSSFLEENKLKLKDSKIKVKASGIEEASSVDMSKYIKLEYKGYNKHATAEATLLKDKMKEDFGEEIASKLANRIRLNIVNNENLTNGNQVEIKLNTDNSYLQEIGIELVSDIVKIEVEGLKEATELDAFKDIKVDVTGMSPNISVSISNNSEDECLKTVQYKASKTSGIANGETITITAFDWDKELFNEKGVALQKTTMEYTVNGQAAYIFSLSEINDAVKAELKSIFISKATSKANENYSRYDDNIKWALEQNTDYKYIEAEDINRDISFGTPEVMSMYLLTKKPDVNAKEINIITAIVKVPCKSAKAGVTYNWYVTIQATNASLKSDGGISENTTYSITTSEGKDEESAYQEFVNSKKNNYNVEKISL